MSTSKVRFYETRGLLPRTARQANGYRAYDEADLRIFTLIHEALALGFSLNEIARFMRRPVEERRNKERLVPFLEQKIAAVDRQISDLMQQRDRLGSFVSHIVEKKY